MKKLCMILSLALILCFMVGCQDKGAMAELDEMKAQAAVEEQNIALVKHFLAEIDKKNIDVENIANKAIQDEKILKELFEGILSKRDFIRFNSFKLLMRITDDHPDMIYPKWDFFER